jgi:hypothetical protein
MVIPTTIRKNSRVHSWFNREKESIRLPMILEIALCLVVILELLAPFVSTSYGLDARLHLNWISQFRTLISEGVLVPRWVPSGFYGFGAATFYFYPPVTFYMAAIIGCLTSITSATVLFQTVSFLMTIGSFLTARLFLRSIGSQGYQMNLGAVLYSIAPFRIVELYHRGALPTHVAYVFIPIVWLELVAIMRPDACIGDNKPRWKHIVVLGTSSALLALTSVPVTLVTMICIGTAALAVWRKIRLTVLWDYIMAAGLATVLTAFHFSAVITADSFARVNEMIGIYPKTEFSSLLVGINWLYVYHLFFVYIPPVLIGLAFWKLRISDMSDSTDPETLLARVGLILLIVITYLNILPLSRVVWNTLLPFQLIQFGFRFFSHFVLLAATMVGIARSTAMKRAAYAATWFVVIGAIPPAILIVFNLHIYSHFTAPPEDSPEYRPVFTVALDGFKQTMERHAADPLTSFANVQSNEGLQLDAKLPTSQVFDVTIDTQKTVTFHQFYWPFWHLYANHREIPSHPDSIGRAVAVLPAGHYTATWQLERTPLEYAGLWISGITWSGVLIFWGIGLVRQRVKKKIPIPSDLD